MVEVGVVFAELTALEVVVVVDDVVVAVELASLVVVVVIVIVVAGVTVSVDITDSLCPPPLPVIVTV